MRPSEQRTLAAVHAELARPAPYDDESIVHDVLALPHYDCGCAGTLGQARLAAVTVAWHEAGHAVAALATGARFSSASIRHGHRSEGRVHAIEGGGSQSFVIDAAGQIAERLRGWTMLEKDEDLRAWLATWKGDGGDARRFRAGLPARFAGDQIRSEVAAWRHSEAVLLPLRLTIRQVARALLVHPRHLPYPVITGLAPVRTPGSPGKSSSGSRRTAGTRPPRAATTRPAPRR